MRNLFLSNMYTDFRNAVVKKDPPVTIYNMIKLHNYNSQNGFQGHLRGAVPYKFQEVEKIREEIKDAQKLASKSFELSVTGKGGEDNLLMYITRLDRLFETLEDAEHDLAIEVARML